VIPFEQAQSIVDYVWAQAGRTHPPKVVAISKTATRSVATANRLRIRIPRHGIKTTVLLHEVAHSMTGDIDKPGDHGEALAGTLMRLVSQHIPTFQLAELMRTAELEGVDFSLAEPNASEVFHGRTRKESQRPHGAGTRAAVCRSAAASARAADR
jgi:hypothetical protein